MLMPTSTPAIVGIGNTSTNAKSIVPKSNFFILQSPLFIPDLTFMEPDSEVIVCDNSMRFSEGTFILMIARIIET